MSTELRNTPVQGRSSRRLEQLDAATKKAIELVGRDRVTTAMIADLAVPRASIGTVYRYGPDRIFWLNRVQPVATHGIERVLALHEHVTMPSVDGEDVERCRYDEEEWPCPTVAFLTEEAEA